MILLEATTETLVVTLGGANAHDFIATYETLGPGQKQGEGELGSQETALAATTANTVILAAPASGVRKVLKRLSVRNGTANSTTVAISKRVSSTNYAIGPTITLADGQSAVVEGDGRIVVYNKTGEKKADA
jgi:hypothetical protein